MKKSGLYLLAATVFLAVGCAKKPGGGSGTGGTAQEAASPGEADVADSSGSDAGTRLLKAAERGDLGLLAKLLGDGVGPDVRDRFERTPLLRAAECGHTDIVELLLDHDVDIDARDGWGFTAFHRALASRQRDVAKLLIVRGADVVTSARKGQTPLHAAPAYGIGIVRTLLSRGADVNARTRANQTPLLRAAEAGSPEVVQLLLSHGADPNVVGRCDDEFVSYYGRLGEGDRYFASPLHVAVVHGAKEKVRLLLASGANPNLQDSLGRRPASIAMDSRHREIAALLVSHGADVTLHLAAYTGTVRAIEDFIAKGADVNARDERGRTPLLLAVSGGHLDATRLLVTAGDDVNAGDAGGWTPIHEAACQGRRNIGALLVTSGARVNALTSRTASRGEGRSREYYCDGTTPLHAAVRHVDMASLLIRNGADVNAPDGDGWTPLKRAAFQGDKRIAKTLIDAGADVSIHLAALVGHAERVRRSIASGVDVNARDDEGLTPLFLATRGGHSGVVDMLMAHGADPNARCGWDEWHPLYWHRPRAEHFDSSYRTGTPAEPGSGLTALHHAAELGFADVAEVLIARAAEIGVKDPLGRTPLNVAAYAGWGDVVETLLNLGADPNAKDHDGRTALDHAREAGFRDVCAVLGDGRDDPSPPLRGPRRVVITDPNAVRAFLGWEGIAHDRVWIPAHDDLKGLDDILRAHLQANLAIGVRGGIPREPVLSSLRRYHREYGGFMRNGRRHILCNMFLMDPNNMFVSARSADSFTFIADGYWCVVQAVFDLDTKSLVEIQCNGAA